MDVVGVIPIRYGSTRLAAKALADILGKPMIQHIYENSLRAKVLDDLIIATDDERIKESVESFGGKAVLTSREHSSGTERLTEVVFDLDVKIIVNIQGDEPLVHPSMINDAAYALLDDEQQVMASLMYPIEDEQEFQDPNTVKVVTDKDGFALYFSRSNIPNRFRKQEVIGYKHIGIYAYTKDFLLTFKGLRPTPLEEAEGLEQLRVLEHGHRIKMIKTSYPSIGVDTEEDLQRVIDYLKTRPI